MREHGFETLKCKLGGFAPELEEWRASRRCGAAVGPRGQDPHRPQRRLVAAHGAARAAPAGERGPGVRRGAGALQPASGDDTAALRRLRGSGPHPHLRRRRLRADAPAPGGARPGGGRGDVPTCSAAAASRARATGSRRRTPCASPRRCTAGPSWGWARPPGCTSRAAHPDLRHAIDGHYHHYVDDVLVGGKLRYEDGAMRGARGAGAGRGAGRRARWSGGPTRRSGSGSGRRSGRRPSGRSGIGASVPGGPARTTGDAGRHRGTRRVGTRRVGGTGRQRDEDVEAFGGARERGAGAGGAGGRWPRWRRARRRGGPCGGAGGGARGDRRRRARRR